MLFNIGFIFHAQFIIFLFEYPSLSIRKMNIVQKMTQKSLFGMKQRIYLSNAKFCIDVASQKLNDTVFVRHAHS